MQLQGTRSSRSREALGKQRSGAQLLTGRPAWDPGPGTQDPGPGTSPPTRRPRSAPGAGVGAAGEMQAPGLRGLHFTPSSNCIRAGDLGKTALEF